MTSTAPPSHLRKLGKYVLIRRLAVGGMSEVYEARAPDRARDARVVLKVLLPQHVENAEFARMFAHEGRINAALSHPNLVEVHEFGEADGHAFLAMELVEGVTLSDLCTAPLEIGLALYVVRELLEALAHVHEAKGPDGAPLAIVHRDVSPHNILLSTTGVVKLGDFGIARSSLRDTRTTTGVLKGKLRYMSPEQTTLSTVDLRSDLYAVGLILFELVTGESFIRGATEIEVLRAAEAPPFRAPSELVPVDKRIDLLVRNAVARFPEERYQSARAFLADVDDARRGIGKTSGASELAARVAELRARSGVSTTQPLVHEAIDLATSSTPRANKTKMFILTGTAAALVAGGVSIALLRRDETPQRHLQYERGSAPVPAVLDGKDGGTLRISPATPPRVELAETLRDATPPSREPEPEPTETKIPGRTKLGRSRVRDAHFEDPQSRAETPALQVDANIQPATVGATEAQARLRALSARLDAMRASMQSRGILVQDLDPPQQAAIQRLRSSFVAGQTEGTEPELDALEHAVREIRVDGPFVRRKLERMNRLVQSADPTRVNTEELDAISGAALQEYLAGRFEATNARLNRLWALLARANQN